MASRTAGIDKKAVVDIRLRPRCAIAPLASRLILITILAPDLNPLNYRVCDALLEAYHKLRTKPKTIAELKEALQLIWGNLPQGPIDKAAKRLIKAAEG